MPQPAFDGFFSSDARNFRPSAIRAFASLINNPDIISFAGGVPSPDSFPAEELAQIAGRVIRENRAVSLQYGPTRGLPRLREQIAEINGSRGVRCDAGGVLVTTGSQQALNLVAQTLLDPGDVVLVELPTYIGGTSSFHGRSARLAGVAQDDDGIVIESLVSSLGDLRSAGARVKFLYTIPNFQNPSGRLMTQQRRARLLEVADRHDFLIIEDDPYGELVFSEDANTTPIKALPDSERIIYLGSFSKVLAPGLRCGWVTAAEPLLKQFEIAKEAADLCSGMLDQSIVDEFCFSGRLPGQVREVRDFYRAKRNVIISALEQNFTGRARWTDAKGGLFTFLTLQSETDTASTIRKAIDAGVAYIPGAAFFVDGSGTSSMRLTFAKEPAERIVEGISRLSRVFGDA